MKKIYLITTLAVLVLGAGTTLATKNQVSAEYEQNILISQSEIKSDQVFYQQRGVAIKGTDTVAYFSEGKAVKGDKKYSYQWGNTTWWFKNEENRDLFAQNPEKYAPQFGGFCAWAVSQNYTAPIDPQAWTIVDGKLYLNYNKSVQRTWSQDIQGNITKGNSNWPNLLAGLQK